MKKLYPSLCLILLALIPVGCMHSTVAKPTQSAKPHPITAWHYELMDKEKEIWDAYKLKDKAALKDLLAEDYYAIEDADGKIMTKTEALQSVAGLDIKTYELTDLSVIEINEGAAIVRYKVRMKGAADKHAFVPHWSMASSVWVKRAGKWLNLMYQETEIGK